MKKIKKASLSILVSLCLLSGTGVVNLKPTLKVFANSLSAEKTEAIEVNKSPETESVFKDKTIGSSGYMYNLDESADYVYAEFNEGGYAIFAKQTMEMLEYSATGSLPYDLTSSRRYYAGPTNYLQKENEKFVEVISKSEVTMTTSEITAYAKKVRKNLIEDKLEKYQSNGYESQTAENLLNSNGGILKSGSNAPSIDTKHLITANSSGTFIYNKAYFSANPTIGENILGQVYGNGNSGTCGPVAAQLLLSYNNYYNDRRIIPDKYLNGYSDTTKTVVDKELNPNYCTNPATLNGFTTGTRSDGNDSNSFYYKMITTIMKPNTHGAYLSEVKDGMVSYLNEYISASGYNLKYKHNYNLFSGYYPVDPQEIRSEIDFGRPVIIEVLDSTINFAHCVVGYGYQDYTYTDTGNTYSGYVVHFGWYDKVGSKNNIWINESWCKGYISLKINHSHDYVKVGIVPNTIKIEYKCVSCGHRFAGSSSGGGGGRFELWDQIDIDRPPRPVLPSPKKNITN